MLAGLAREASQGICLLYAGVITWLNQAYKEIFLRIRPKIKTGKLWRQIPLPETSTLGQHTGLSSMHIQLPRATLLYFNDHERTHGVRTTCGELWYEAKFRQVPSVDPLLASQYASSNVIHREIKESQYVSEKYEFAAVRAVALRYGTDEKDTSGDIGGDSTNRRTSGASTSGEQPPRNSATSFDARADPRRSNVSETGDLMTRRPTVDSVDGYEYSEDDDSDYDSDVYDVQGGVDPFEEGFLITDLTKAVREYEEESGCANGCKKELLFTATFVSVQRGAHRPDVRVRSFSTAARMSTSTPVASPSPRSTPERSFHLSSSPPGDVFAEDRSGGSAGFFDDGGTPVTSVEDKDDDAFLYNVQVKTSAIVYTTFTADVIWSIYKKYLERRELKASLSPEAVNVETMHDPPGANSPAANFEERQRPIDSLLDKLVQDSQTNFFGSSSVRRRNSAGYQLAALDYEDLLSLVARVRCSRIQVFYRGPETHQHLTQTASEVILDICQHKSVWKKGRLECKDSWSTRYENMQYYIGSCAPTGYLWLPPDCVEDDPDAEIPNGISLLQPSCRFRYKFVFYYYDQAIAKLHNPEAVTHEQHMSLGENPLHDAVSYEWDKLMMTTTSVQWTGFQDVFNNVLCAVFPLADRERDQKKELDTLKFKSALARLSSHDATDAQINTARENVLQLQEAVTKLIRGNDELERTILSIVGERENNDYYNDDPDVESEVEALHTSMKHDWVNNRHLLAQARKDLDVQLQVLRETQWDQQRSDGSSGGPIQWGAKKSSVIINDWHWTMLDTTGRTICNAKFNKVKYDWMSWNKSNVSGTQEFECQDFEVTNKQLRRKMSLSARDKAHAAGLSPQPLAKHIILGRYSGKNTPTSGRVSQGINDKMLRIFLADGAPVGGIPVANHFEVNLSPLSVSLTKSLTEQFTEFFTPGEGSEGDKVDGARSAAAAVIHTTQTIIEAATDPLIDLSSGKTLEAAAALDELVLDDDSTDLVLNDMLSTASTDTPVVSTTRQSSDPTSPTSPEVKPSSAVPGAGLSMSPQRQRRRHHRRSASGNINFSDFSDLLELPSAANSHVGLPLRGSSDQSATTTVTAQTPAAILKGRQRSRSNIDPREVTFAHKTIQDNFSKELKARGIAELQSSNAPVALKRRNSHRRSRSGDQLLATSGNASLGGFSSEGSPTKLVRANSGGGGAEIKSPSASAGKLTKLMRSNSVGGDQGGPGTVVGSGMLDLDSILSNIPRISPGNQRVRAGKHRKTDSGDSNTVVRTMSLSFVALIYDSCRIHLPQSIGSCI